jgi:hypothetical protein
MRNSRTYCTFFKQLKVSKSQKQFTGFSILPKNNETHYPEHLLFLKYAQDSEFRSFLEELRTPQIAFKIY